MLVRQPYKTLSDWLRPTDILGYATLCWIIFPLLYGANCLLLWRHGLLQQFVLTPSPYYLIFLALAGIYGALRWMARRPPSPWQNAGSAAGHFVHIIGFLLIFSSLLSLQMYGLIALFGARPLVDATLEQLDLALGFIWLDYLNWTRTSLGVGTVLYNAYYSVIWQLPILMIAALSSERQAVMYRFLLANVLALLMVNLTASLLPSEGYMALKAYDTKILEELHWRAGYAHLEYYRALRAGNFAPVLQGKFIALISFPSYHSVLGVLLLWSFWSFKWLRWPFAILNLLLLAAIPAVGGHSLMDALAGIAIALVSIALLHIKSKPTSKSLPS